MRPWPAPQAGARAIGCVFYAKSPRCVTAATAREIRRALPPEVACVGVFVDEPFEGIMAMAAHTGFTAVQLHGSESPEFVRAAASRGAFRHQGALCRPGARRSRRRRDIRPRPSSWNADRGRCPAGTPTPGNGARAAALGERHPLILAGGLDPENAAQAVRAALPDAVDVSSGVEAGPGRKNIRKVEQFIAAVATAGARRRIFA